MPLSAHRPFIAALVVAASLTLAASPRDTRRNVIDKLMGGSPSAHDNRHAAGSPMRLAPLGVPQTLVIGAKDARWGPVGWPAVYAALKATVANLKR